MSYDQVAQVEAKEEKKPSTIIIKRVQGGHAAHHGGAWKIAYADFVTAMMAFFLLMWLLSAVPTEKLKGIAQYFEPSNGKSGELGMGFRGGTVDRPQKKGLKDEDKTQGFKYGVQSVGDIVSVKVPGTPISKTERDNQILLTVQKELKNSVEKDSQLSIYKDSMQFNMTPEGLTINISGEGKYPMFDKGSAQLTDFSKLILFKVAKLIKFTPNLLKISGHTDKELNNSDGNYSDWELSADRANSARKYLVESGVPPDQIGMVVGRADTEPVDAQDPYSPLNRRITITLLRNSVVPYEKMVAPQNVIGSPSENSLGTSAQ